MRTLGEIIEEIENADMCSTGDYVVTGEWVEALRVIERELVDVALVVRIAQEAHRMGRVYENSLHMPQPATELDLVADMARSVCRKARLKEN